MIQHQIMLNGLILEKDICCVIVSSMKINLKSISTSIQINFQHGKINVVIVEMNCSSSNSTIYCYWSLNNFDIQDIFFTESNISCLMVEAYFV